MNNTIRSFFVAILCLGFYALFSQSFQYNYLDMAYSKVAKTPFTTEFKNMSVRIDGEEHLQMYGMTKDEVIDGYFAFHKYEYVPEHGDLLLTVHIGAPQYLGAQRQKYTKDEDGTKVTYHYYEGSVSIPMRYALWDGARNLIEEKITYSATDHLTFDSESYTTASALEKAWLEGKEIIISKKLGAALIQRVEDMSEVIKDQYDDRTATDRVTIFDVKKADKINAEFINSAVEKILRRSGKSINSWDVDKRQSIESAFEKGLTFDPQDKNERIAFAASAFNLAVLNMLMGDYSKAEEYRKKGLRADRKAFDFDKLEQDINARMERASTSDVASKAYVASYQEGADSNLPDASVSEVSNSGTEGVIEHVITKSLDTISGYVEIIVKQGKIYNETMPFIDEVSVVPVSGGTARVFKGTDVIGVKSGEDFLAIIPTPLGVSAKKPPLLYRIIAASSDSSMVAFETTYHISMPGYMNAPDDEKLRLFGVGDADGVDIYNIQTGSKFALSYNKPLSKIFSSCPIIVSKAGQKSYERTRESLIELVGDYDSCL